MPDLISFSGLTVPAKQRSYFVFAITFKFSAYPHKRSRSGTMWRYSAICAKKPATRFSKEIQGLAARAPGAAPRQERSSLVLTIVRLGLYWLDALHLLWLVRSQGVRTDVLLFDRYIYDELANLPLERFAVRA